MSGAGENPGGIEIAPGVRVSEGALRFSYASSSGPGGQNVNKRATKAILRVRPEELPMNAAARARLLGLARTWLTDDGELVIASDEFRSQGRNRDACLERLRDAMVRALTPPKPRRKTRVPAGVKKARLEGKRRRGETKQSRRPPRAD